jgi:hypothetical protein
MQQKRVTFSGDAFDRRYWRASPAAADSVAQAA